MGIHEWIGQRAFDTYNFLFDFFLGDPTGAIAVSIFMIALFTFKPTRIFAIASTLIYILMI